MEGSEVPPGQVVDAPLQVQTCEVRWIRPGRLQPEMLDWSSRFRVLHETRQDDYLRRPYLAGLSIKIRGGASFDVKQDRGVAGELALDGRATGRIHSWLKLSFPLPGHAGIDAASARDWTRVAKHRRIGVFPAGKQLGDPARCSVELSDVNVAGTEWWTVAFEASGPDAANDIRHAAALVFADPLPSTGELRAEDAMSYAAWIQLLEAPT